ncbi:MAG: NADH dehydrogenase [Candidatus Sedimenticola endophacoides]|uniref:NADH-quinone oxidoreductase subunit C n=1 Tax=Candidatus Sedimenticola endophacoides TaxID=2548426 RepID=A0A657Q7I7_9GAMM|nr:MAG: NADH dehydrogenase [Candidatus Sedimenticola endophacoides]OQX35169.1 MAG: NADH dehydrogenase [Candidatus Sedimenticola endophacoides]OQX38907.1 MAG: NADH dehydrogenase [Candidatus Sedimenticola endophacoides]OQX41293.1 MAG: NADH dehydrogenase [Candidatus Sedimenticola endophacoides]OQX42789.1 MAG: NADH dehydrogenase [Candidatus Sedimenticola endophacoides]
MHELHERLKAIFPLGELTVQRPDLAFITLGREHLRPLLLELRHRHGFTHLVLLTAVDWIEEGCFQLTYLLNDRAGARDLGLRVMLPREGASMESIHDLWPTAATYQRELREMFGIDFPASPGVDEPFILEGWRDIPPYRRDFDTLKFAEENFNQRPGRATLDPARHMRDRLHPEGE